MKTQFIVKKLEGPVKSGGSLKVGATFSGDLSVDGKEIYFKDTNNVEWTFYVGDTAEIVVDALVFSKNNDGNFVVTFKSNINLDNGHTNVFQGVFESTMELFTDDQGPTMIEWDADIDVVEIGLEYYEEDGGLVGYDGVFELPSQAIALIRHAGFIVGEDF